jgi:hypothetical protein
LIVMHIFWFQHTPWAITVWMWNRPGPVITLDLRHPTKKERKKGPSNSDTASCFFDFNTLHGQPQYEGSTGQDPPVLTLPPAFLVSTHFMGNHSYGAKVAQARTLRL